LLSSFASHQSDNISSSPPEKQRRNKFFLFMTFKIAFDGAVVSFPEKGEVKQRIWLQQGLA
jgi:hypothetical protein